MPTAQHNSEHLSSGQDKESIEGQSERSVDVYFSADVETDGPIPGPFSMLSFALVYAGAFDGQHFTRPASYSKSFYIELKPISNEYQPEALQINGLNRERLCEEGESPQSAMTRACQWVKQLAGKDKPVLVAYPLTFDWTWLYWYFVRFSSEGSPFDYSRGLDIKTAYAIKAAVPIAEAGRSKVLSSLRPRRSHTHNALDDAIEQAEIFANIFQWKGRRARTS